jgi:hypothetical protein
VLPRDPLEVLYLEQEERNDPERGAGLGQGRVLPDPVGCRKPYFQLEGARSSGLVLLPGLPFPTVNRAGLIVALACVALAGFVLASCGGDDDSEATLTETTTQTTQTTQPPTTTTTPPPPPPPTEVRVHVVGGAPQGGIVRESTDKGDRVVVIVTSDVDDHVHVHGYDRFADVGPKNPARIHFRARIPGRFVIELEERHSQIAELTVRP